MIPVVLLIELILIPVVGFIAARTMADGWFCVFGKHYWTGTYHSCDIDMLTQKITPYELRYDCGMCGKEKQIRPGSRKWNKHWAKVKLNMESPEWKEHRAGFLLHEGHEIEIATGDPVEKDQVSE